MASGDVEDVKWLYRVAGISTVVFFFGYLAIIGLYSMVGAPPSGGEAMLQYLDGKTTSWWGIIVLSILTDMLLIPIGFALYFALKPLNRSVMLMAVAFIGLFVVLDLAVTWPNYTALVSLSGDYASATSEAQRAGYVAAANYATAVLGSSTFSIYAILTLALGILLASVVMLRSAFGKATAYIGLATGILGFVSVLGGLAVDALSNVIIITSLLTMIWALLVGIKLYKLGRSGAAGLQHGNDVSSN
jgi:hypothetical protein